MESEVTTLLVFSVTLLGAGLVAGTIAGLLGVGGGIVLVPVLYYVFSAMGGVDPSVCMHLAVGTSLAAMVPTSIRSALAHRSRGAVDEALFIRWLPAALAGAIAGIFIAARIDGAALTLIFAIFASIAALHMAFGKESWRIASDLPSVLAQRVMAFFIAGVSVMIGIGGGTFTVPMLTLFGYPIHRAVGTAAAIGVLIAIPGAIGFSIAGLDAPGRPGWSLGYTSLIGVAVIIPATIATAPIGAALAHRLDRTWLRSAFAIFLAATGIRMLLNL